MSNQTGTFDVTDYIEVTHKPSHFQNNIFDWIVNGTGNAVVDAVAGAGKTTTLEQSIQLIKKVNPNASILYCVFNKHNQQEADRKFGHLCEVRTVHSLGFAAVKDHFSVRYLKANGYKYWDLAKEAAHERGLAGKEARQAVGELKGLLDMTRLTLTDWHDEDALAAMCDAYDLMPDDWMIEAIGPLLDKSIVEIEEKRRMDFTDMVFMPVHMDMAVSQYDWVLVDEAQDLSNVNRKIVLMHLSPFGRLIAVGDSRQAIMGFAGGSTRSYELIQEETDAITLPLSICYRCPTSHIHAVQPIVPHIEPSDFAKEGVREYVSYDFMREEAQPGDLILSRKTAPLILNCLRMIRTGKPSYVKGAEIGKGLIKICNKAWGDKHDSLFEDEFEEALDAYEQREISKMIAKEKSEAVIANFGDRIDSVRFIFEEYHPRTLAGMEGYITSLFNEDNPDAIVFCTVHRSKGLEAERVMVIEYDDMPLMWKDQNEEQLTQEYNVKYVSGTRSMSELYLVTAAEA